VLSPADIQPQEITITCEDGIKLAGERWTASPGETDSANTIRILCLHGWLDNAATFDRLIPPLISRLLSHQNQTVDVVAIDLPGHGRSSHKSLDGPSSVLADFVYYVYDALHQLGWNDEDIVCIGHSMGASISLMYAAAFPLSKMILLDSLGPRPEPTATVTKRLERHIRTRLKGKPPCSIYPDLETAIETRCLTATTFPGNQYISIETATSLVKRASVIEDDGKSLRFLHDQRLKWPSILCFTEEQLHQLYRDVATPKNRRHGGRSVGSATAAGGSDSNGDSIPPTSTCILLAEDGMPFSIEDVALAGQLMQAKVCQKLPGSHHFHSDPTTVDAVVDAIVQFLM
jgi:pimeloyl-ACP methyl ester carboxylesterase